MYIWKEVLAHYKQFYVRRKEVVAQEWICLWIWGFLLFVFSFPHILCTGEHMLLRIRTTPVPTLFFVLSKVKNYFILYYYIYFMLLKKCPGKSSIKSWKTKLFYVHVFYKQLLRLKCQDYERSGLPCAFNVNNIPFDK